jgi:hypothetical protein
MQATQNNIRLARIRGRIEAAEDHVRVFAEEYDQGDAATQDALRAVWEAKFASRAEDPGMADRRFDQYLSLGRRSLRRRTNRAIRESHELAAGADTKIQFLLKKPSSEKLPQHFIYGCGLPYIKCRWTCSYRQPATLPQQPYRRPPSPDGVH